MSDERNIYGENDNPAENKSGNINTESTQKVRLYTASLISRSIPDEVQFTDSMTDNIKMLVKTALSSNKKDSESITVSEPVISNIEFDKNDNRLSADEEAVPVR